MVLDLSLPRVFLRSLVCNLFVWHHWGPSFLDALTQRNLGANIAPHVANCGLRRVAFVHTAGNGCLYSLHRLRIRSRCFVPGACRSDISRLNRHRSRVSTQTRVGLRTVRSLSYAKWTQIFQFPAFFCVPAVVFSGGIPDTPHRLLRPSVCIHPRILWPDACRRFVQGAEELCYLCSFHTPVITSTLQALSMYLCLQLNLI
ncbi:hypothetical protein B0H13DRAFT_583855 [Mycena leptocephala]|nr:hypothetical protein B0H13DRAFT_583855 [Mycena leptocephala]